MQSGWVGVSEIGQNNKDSVLILKYVIKHFYYALVAHCSRPSSFKTILFRNP